MKKALFLFAVLFIFNQSLFAQIPTITNEEKALAQKFLEKNNFPKAVNSGIMNGRASNLVKPELPENVVCPCGIVKVAVLLGEDMKVIDAQAVSGRQDFFDSVEQAAKKSTFSRSMINSEPVKFFGYLVYNFNFKQTTITSEEKTFAKEIAKDWDFGKAINGGIVNGKARDLVMPVCPKDVSTSGIVKVFVLVDESGKVTQAEAVSGDYWLYDSAETAVKESTFSLNWDIENQVLGYIIYNFKCASDVKTPKVISGGHLNSKAKNLVQPTIPPNGHYRPRPNAKVRVRVLIDSQKGNVIAAKAVFGHPLLRAAAEQAARASVFSPTNIDGEQVLVSGILTYDLTLRGGKITTKYSVFN